MFSPHEQALERGWPGKVDGDRVIQVAAQTLQAFFTGGGEAREHAVYPLDEVDFRAPVLHPPSIRIFSRDDDFVFANPASIFGPEATVPLPEGAHELQPVQRFVAVIGADGAIGGFTLMNDWRAPGLHGTKAHDFAISLGPTVLTPDEFDVGFLDWDALVAHAARNTHLLPGDLIASPASAPLPPVGPGSVVELGAPPLPFGVLRNRVAALG